MAIQALIPIAIGAYKLYDSIRKNSKANKLARENKRPVFNAAGEIAEVHDLATNEVGNRTMQDYATSQLEQNQAAGIDAILKSGGRADFGEINSRYGQNLKQILSQLDRERSAKIAAYNNAAYNKALSTDAEFMYNKDAPFKDLKQREAQLKQQGAQSLNEGISDIASGVGNYLTSELSPGQYEQRQMRIDDRDVRRRSNAVAGMDRTQGAIERAPAPAAAQAGLVNPNIPLGYTGPASESLPYSTINYNEFGELYYN